MASLKSKLTEVAKGQTGLAFDPLGREQARLLNIPIDQVEPDPDQPRKNVGDIEELTASILEHGLIQPCIVSHVDGERYRIIAGERRYTAAKAAGLTAIPAIVRSIEEHRKLEVQLIENIHRKELNPVEEAGAFQRLITDYNLSQRELARRIGKSPAAINETLRILTLPEEILTSVRTSEQVSRSALLEVAKLPSPEEQVAFWDASQGGTLTVRKARTHKAESSEAKPKVKNDFRYITKSATVTVTFDRLGITVDDICEALTEAMNQAQFGNR